MMTGLCGALLFALGCLPDDAPKGLRETARGQGPKVVFKIEARPLPDIPFPNDVVTRQDAQSATGLRLNLPITAPTSIETNLRLQLQALDGFGTSTPITVRFDAPLDLDVLAGTGRPPEQDPVLVVDVGLGEHFGERFLLDLGRGYHPLVLPETSGYSPYGARAGESNLVFETVDEDVDGDGQLSSVEDTDGDGHLDVPNVYPVGADPDYGLLNWYERETNTLVLRPIQPLRPGRPYAVVLTKRVLGRGGEPVRSPFEFVHHTRQTEGLAALESALAKHGVALDEVAFAWRFTTGTVGVTLGLLRAGLHGRGVFSALATYPDDLSVQVLTEQGEREAALLPGETLAEVARVVADDPETGVTLASSLASIDYLVAGSFVTPYLLGDPEQASRYTQWKGDEDERFRMDAVTGEITVEAATVPFWCTVPRATESAQAPFPVVIYGHDLGGSRLDMLVVAGALARWGLATCTLDAVGHGTVLEPEVATQLDALFLAEGQVGPSRLRTALRPLRVRDMNNDGWPDSGGSTFTLEAAHTRDAIRQTVLDWVQFVRVLRGFDGARRWSQAGVSGTIAGDFDGDGVVDFGGPEGAVHLAGVGYGGIIASVVAGVEPDVDRVALLSSGARLVEMMFRTAFPHVRDRAVLPGFGPLVVGHPTQAGLTRVSFHIDDGSGVVHLDPVAMEGLPFAELPRLVRGDRILLTNLRSGQVSGAVVDGQGAFELAVAADSATASEVRVRFELEPWREDFSPVAAETTVGLGDGLRLDVYDLSGRLKNSIEAFDFDLSFQGVIYRAGEPLVAVAQGWGLRRQSPTLRRVMDLWQLLLEPADPVNYARRVFDEPTEGGGHDLLVLLTAGDALAPVASGLAFARAAGLFADAPEVFPHLNELGVTAGIARLGPLADVDNLSDGDDGFDTEHREALRITRTHNGRVAALRIGLVDPGGSHGVAPAVPGEAWNGSLYLMNLMGQFLSDGDLTHRRCLGRGGCR